MNQGEKGGRTQGWKQIFRQFDTKSGNMQMFLYVLILLFVAY